MNYELLQRLDGYREPMSWLLDAGQHEKAVTLGREMLAAAAAAAGEDSPEYGLALRSFASLYRISGDIPRACELYEQSLPRLERMGDDFDVYLIETLTTLAGLYSALRDV